MRDIVETARRFRYEARQRGSVTSALLARSYARVVKGIRLDAVHLEQQVRALRLAGIEPDAALVESLADMQALRRRTALGLVKAADDGMHLLGLETPREYRIARNDAHALMALRIKDLPEDRLLDAGVRNLVGVTHAGPLRDLLVARAGDDADKVADILTDALVRDRPMRQTAEDIRQLIEGSSMSATLRMVRTETHRARREAQRLTYANTRGVLGWTWVCSLTPRSCGLCWAQHGQHFPLSEPMATHPNCSCECAPWFGEETDEADTGLALFDALSATEQATAIGAATARAYHAGAFTLDQLIRTGRHPQWGPTGGQAPLSAVLGAQARDFYRP
jgi:hypothetical protein